MGKIELDGLSKHFGDVVAVDEVDASITEGAYTMILGPSGSGKSTLLRMIAGLESPTSGEVRIDGNDVTEDPPRERDLSMVFQNLALWDHKTVRENMAFGLKMDGVDAASSNERVERTAELLEIEDKLDASPTQLSGGQQQRVALGRSLVREPEVILFDEPLSSLDQRLRLRMRTELRRIQQETDTTFVHVTHNQEDAMTVADEIMVVNEGVVEQFDRPLDLYYTPANDFVANFIGSPSMNLLDATFVAEDGVRFDVDGGLSLDVSPSWAEHFTERVSPGPVRIGVRPEAFVFDENETGPTIEGTVSIVEPFGDSSWYYLDAGIGTELVLQSTDEELMRSLSVGDSVVVTVPPETIHAFDASTGESLGTTEVADDKRSTTTNRNV